MADSESFHSHHRHLSSTTPSTFSHLLFSNELDDHDPAVDGGRLLLGCLEDGGDMVSHSFRTKPPELLSFGGYPENDEEGDNVGGDMGLFGSNEVALVTTCSDSTSASSPPASDPNRKRNGSTQAPVQIPSTGNDVIIKAGKRTSGGNKRKAKSENPVSSSNTRGRREKLGDRITALQQLVSPFGKTDTASVLHEAMGYIRFLHDQVHVLCCPYLQPQPKIEESGEGDEPSRDLTSRGLCLVPVECTVHVASSNGADYWSPGALVNDVVEPGDNYHAVNMN